MKAVDAASDRVTLQPMGTTYEGRQQLLLIITSRYNVIIMPSGTYANLDKNAQEKLRTCISGGGTLIATEDATKYLAANGFTKVLFRPTTEDKRILLCSCPTTCVQTKCMQKKWPVHYLKQKWI